ncbi:LLM class oxidoreductase [Massilia niastensis]|uniref:LLM class oxidoreductase n=1 Tax=Massilia niastensis TaxID=544911 RepID=UPI00036AAA17|nr:LLM class oxidoreductase [Massilia niastensis]
MEDVSHHPGFLRMFAPDHLTLGFILPLEAYPDTPAPTMRDHAAMTRYADEAGFAGLWARDVPLYDPMFGDTGQMYEPFTYLGYLAGNTQRIALATGSAVITLRHPLHLAKQATTVDQLSSGRMVLGISSGDRPTEYPAFGVEHDFESRGERFRDAFGMFSAATRQSFPRYASDRFGHLDGGLDLVPRPAHGRIPAIVTGRSRQEMEWIAQHADGWLYYFVPPEQVAPLIGMWRALTRQAAGETAFKPFAQGLFFDLADDPNHPVQRIHSGIRAGRNTLVDYLAALQKLGVNHVAMNLKASRRPAAEVLQELAEYMLPVFPSNS